MLINVKDVKRAIRYEVWGLMEREGIARFPRPVYGRIPNFVGAEVAALKLTLMDIYRRSKVVKVNPDSPQSHVRLLALRDGKLVLMPSPRIKAGFILLDPSRIPGDLIRYASTIKGAFELGEEVDLSNIPKIDLIVIGSVAVNVYGARLGKGEGYAELEYGILRELNVVTELTPVVTTVHDIQVVNHEIPVEPHDLVVDYIVTPTKVIKTKPKYSKPRGIYWDLITEEKLNEIPVLRRLKELKNVRNYLN